MARFRYDGSGWSCADGIVTLGRQVEAAWPERHGADGTVASAGHAKWPASDHGIDPYNIVRALDVGVVADQGAILADQLRQSRDRRLAYVIHDGRILRSYAKPGIPAWTWAPYSGSNPHASHVHISTIRSRAVDGWGEPWNIDLQGGNMLRIEDLQTALNEAGRTDPDGEPLQVDGVYGPKTQFAFVAALTADEASKPAPAVLVNGDTVRIWRQ